MKITAILVVRNEEVYIEETIKYLIENNISIVVIDNESTDNTVAICKKYYPENITNIETIPFDGTFNLQAHIAEAKKMLKTLETDWVISHAADERIISNRCEETLYDAIVRVSKLGFDIINLDEFVFIYENNEIDYRGADFFNAMRYYYFFEPKKLRLMRIFRRDVFLSGRLAGVHNIEINSRGKLYPYNFVLQHHLALSYQHAKEKYLTRTYNQSDLELGWHSNRINMTSENLAAPKNSLLMYKKYCSGALDKNRPYKKHFWEW
ncbi:glycosyltransferase [Thiolapillus brandeum]|uniref:Glycosyltransferase 2-like domain-containing protein n=1 Tax=Thiolapillus brandeum TaxID=1076588 RepID=A0A7U6GKZ9_9GAMM|nr:glycosyltransferase [Thiolapillus brandeum]BAO45613.1 hypothetical protein TBH_C2709 [Thiolapillus brandeum]